MATPIHSLLILNCANSFGGAPHNSRHQASFSVGNCKWRGGGSLGCQSSKSAFSGLQRLIGKKRPRGWELSFLSVFLNQIFMKFKNEWAAVFFDIMVTLFSWSIKRYHALESQAINFVISIDLSPTIPFRTDWTTYKIELSTPLVLPARRIKSKQLELRT